MNSWSFVSIRTLMLIASLGVISGCGEELQVNGRDDQQQAISSGTPFAFVSRDSENVQNALATNSLEPSAFNPGAQLFVRAAVSSDAKDVEILKPVFGDQAYDVKDLNVSSDGELLIFSARGVLSDDSWNLYEYQFATGRLHRLISNLSEANAGHDTNPAYTNDNIIIFSSDRHLTAIGSDATDSTVLFSMNRNGDNIEQITQGDKNDIQATTLKDGHMVFMRWQTQSEACSGGNAFTSNACAITKSLGGSAQHIEKDSFNFYRVAPNGEQLTSLFDSTTLNAQDEEWMQLNGIIQGADGHMMAIVKNKFNPMMGGEIVELRGPAASKSRSATDGAVYEYVKPVPVSGQEINLATNTASVNGWYSAFWPYRDGSSRMLVSWSQCMKQEGGVYRPCKSDDNLNGVDPRYGIWVMDVANNTRMPVLQAKKNRVFTEIALAYPNLGENLKFDDDVAEPEVIQPDAGEGDTTNPDTGEGDATNPDAGEGDTTNPDAGEGDTTNPDAGEGDTTNPDAGEGDTTNPEAGEGDATNPDAGEGDATNPDAGEGDATNPDAGDGDATNPDAGEGDATNPDAGEGDATNPDAGEGDTTNPDAGEGDATNPDAGEGDTTNPDAGEGDATNPDAGEGDTTNPDAGDTTNPNAGEGDTTIPLNATITTYEDTSVEFGLAQLLAITAPKTINSITLSDVPVGAILSAGTNNHDGSWSIAAGDLANLAITPTKNSGEDFTLSFEVSTTENTAEETLSGTIKVVVIAVADEPYLEVALDEVNSQLIYAEYLNTINVGTLKTNQVINGTDQDDFIVITHSQFDAGSVSGGKGNDVIEIRGWGDAVNTSITGDGGNDTLIINAEIISKFENLGDNAGKIIFVSGGEIVYNNIESILRTDDATLSGQSIGINISAQLADTDGSESMTDIVLSGLPMGAIVSNSSLNGDGSWSLVDTSVEHLVVLLDADNQQDFTLMVTVNNQDTDAGTQEISTNSTATGLDVSVLAVLDPEDDTGGDPDGETGGDPDGETGGDPDGETGGDPDGETGGDPDGETGGDQDGETGGDPDGETGGDPDGETGGDPDGETGGDPDGEADGDGICKGKGYWKNHNRYAANLDQHIAWPVDEDTQLCGTTWHQLINQRSRGDAWVILGKHYVTAQLNVANDGFVPGSVADALFIAQTQLAQCQVLDADRDFSLSLKATLETYNNDENCGEVPDVVEPQEPDAKTLVHIRSIYDVDGTDRSRLLIPFMAIPALYPMEKRSERFVRVYTKNQDGELQIEGYSDIQPDGSVMFEVPANTDYTFEVVNKHGKALNKGAMLGSDFRYDYLQRHPGYLQANEGETQQCHGCHLEGSDYDHANEVGDPANKGALGLSIPWPSANPFILSVEWGDTMAEALHRSIEDVSVITPNIQYQDNWTILPFRQNPSINIAYEQLQSEQPLSVACQQELTEDCVASINYADHIQPIWNVSNRNEDGNSCVDCHDNRGFTKLDLSDYTQQDGTLASYNALFNNNRTFMFLAATFSTVDEEHCRRMVQPPFLIEPENDCFSCYGQALMNPLGAISSANFFDVFDLDSDDEHWLFNPDVNDSYKQQIHDMHSPMLNAAERKLIAEWLDMGAPQ